MINPSNLTQAIQNLEREAAKETQELHAAEAELTKREEENMSLEREVAVAKKEIDAKARIITENARAIPKLKNDIAEIKREQQKRHTELERVKISYTQELQRAGVKDVKDKNIHRSIFN